MDWMPKAVARVAAAAGVWVFFGPVSGTAQTTSSALVFDHVTVVDVVRGNLMPARRVVVIGRRIEAVGPVDSVPLPAGARVIDARGKYVIPGLWDMHLHLWEAPEAVGYPLLIANGVTGLRDPGSPVPLATLTRWKQEIAAGTRVGPRLVVAGPSIFRCPLLPPAVDYRYGVCVTTPAQARTMVDSLAKAGADFLETYIDSKFTAEPVELFFALAAAARQAGLPFGGHAPAWVASDAADSGARFLNNRSFLWVNKLHVCDDWYANAAGGVEDCAAEAEQLRRHDTWIVVTPPLPRFRYQVDQYRRYLPQALPSAPAQVGPALDRPGTRFDVATWFTLAGSLPLTVRPTTTAAWRAVLGAVDSVTGTVLFPLPGRARAEEAADLPIVAGSDAVFAPSAFIGLPGFTLHDALAMLVADGMTPLGALRAATLSPARRCTWRTRSAR